MWILLVVLLSTMVGRDLSYSLLSMACSKTVDLVADGDDLGRIGE